MSLLKEILWSVQILPNLFVFVCYFRVPFISQCQANLEIEGKKQVNESPCEMKILEIKNKQIGKWMHFKGISVLTQTVFLVSLQTFVGNAFDAREIDIST